MRLACGVAKVGRSSHYRWPEKDFEFRAAFDLGYRGVFDAPAGLLFNAIFLGARDGRGPQTKAGRCCTARPHEYGESA